MLICRCAQSILDETAVALTVSFSKTESGDIDVWIQEDPDADPDDLVKVEWSEARGHLPEPEQLDSYIEDRSHSIVTYNHATKTWDYSGE